MKIRINKSVIYIGVGSLDFDTVFEVYMTYDGVKHSILGSDLIKAGAVERAFKPNEDYFFLPSEYEIVEDEQED